jgi:hypothetical protein
VAGTGDGGHCDLANTMAGAIALAMGAGIQDEHGIVVIRGQSMTNSPIHRESFQIFSRRSSQRMTGCMTDEDSVG